MKKSKPEGSSPVTALAGSFRDPAGFVFRSPDGTLLRQINQAGATDFDLSASSGLFNMLFKKELLIPHRTVSLSRAAVPPAHAVIAPRPVPYITYPFEWSFSQLQDAALLTLEVQKQALQHGMTLKDASAYNVQFVQGKPLFIDTLSFEKYTPGTPWQAYRQFCQHFLAPLALMGYTDLSLSQLSRVYLDGVPLETAVRLLPRKAKLKPGLMMHLVLHARAQKAKQHEHQKPPQRELKQTGLSAILDSLERTVSRMQPLKSTTEWGDYYHNTNYTADAADSKAKLLTEFIKPLKIATVLDLGGNNGHYSRVLNTLGISTLCTDIDPNAVEANYRYAKQHHETTMLPLLVDLTNPGGGLGWQNKERETVQERLQTDAVMALALIHHLAMSNNLPFSSIAACFASFAPYLIIEFVPKTDSQVQKLLATRKDIFPDYTEEGFEQAFAAHYTLAKKKRIPKTKRTLYLYRRK